MPQSSRVIMTRAASRSHRAVSALSRAGAAILAASAEDTAVCEAAGTPPNDLAAVAKINTKKNLFIIAPEKRKNASQQHEARPPRQRSIILPPAKPARLSARCHSERSDESASSYRAGRLRGDLSKLPCRRTHFGRPVTAITSNGDCRYGVST